MAYPETSYMQYTHGSNVNAHLKPITYNTMMNSTISNNSLSNNSLSNNSMVVQAGSTDSSAYMSRPHKTHDKSSSHKHKKHSQSTTYQAFEHSSSQQPLTSSVLAFDPAAKPAKHRKKKKNQEPQPDAHHNNNNNGGGGKDNLAIPIPQKTERTHDAPAHKHHHHKHHHRHSHRHSGHDMAQQSMPSVASQRLEGGDTAMAGYSSQTYG
ncbi:hypothetical protein EV175_006562, partial [Coemansia sp. RSA 1933]